MENMQYADELLREFLVFRGFTSTLQVFEKESNTDIGKGFQVDKIVDLIFSMYVPKFQADKLVGLLSFFKQCVSSPSETVLFTTVTKLEASILRYYIVHALQSGKKEKVIEFFEVHGNDLLQSRDDWSAWFAILYLRNPSLHPQFRVYFSKEWYDALLLSFRNFLSEIFNGIRIPALLKISTEKNTVKRLKNDIKQLNLKLSELQALLEAKEAEIKELRSMEQCAPEVLHENKHSPVSAVVILPKDESSSFPSGGTSRNRIDAATSSLKDRKSDIPSESMPSESQYNSSSPNDPPRSDGETRGMVQDEEFSEVKVEFQESFLGHTNPISRCRFSASGTNIASASVDGTVRIWTYDESTPTTRNATIYCGSEIMSLDWECRYDRLLLIGTADGGIKAWNVDAKRVVCDLNTSTEFPSVLALKCSPVEPIFVSASASASKRSGSTYVDKIGFASLTVWNMKTWKATYFLLEKIHQQ